MPNQLGWAQMMTCEILITPLPPFPLFRTSFFFLSPYMLSLSCLEPWPSPIGEWHHPYAIELSTEAISYQFQALKERLRFSDSMFYQVFLWIHLLPTILYLFLSHSFFVYRCRLFSKASNLLLGAIYFYCFSLILFMSFYYYVLFSLWISPILFFFLLLLLGQLILVFSCASKYTQFVGIRW